MKYYCKSGFYVRQGWEYPCYVFLKDSGWNDWFRYKTLFELRYYDDEGYEFKIGAVKILDKNDPNTILPEQFDELPDNFCSLGCDIDYYQNLTKKAVNFRTFLKRINDLAFNPGLAEDFENEDGLRTSLLRYSEAEKAFRQAKLIINKKSYKEAFQFKYSCRIENADENHEVEFNFRELDNLPNRIIAIVGKNGTGKTQFLSNLALDLSGQRQSKSRLRAFEPRRPLFNKVIAVSYSVFDRFVRPTTSKSFSYKYCGLRDSSGFITKNKLVEIYRESIGKIKDKDRERTWYKILENIIQDDLLRGIHEDLFEREDFEKIAKEGKRILSSGQSVLIYVITEIVANIKPESLILFDEPEMHLHPNAIANLIRMLHSLLEKFDSYAILATHSPIILQEIPSKFVQVFHRAGNTPITRSLAIESFGENLTAITEEVFETAEIKGTYRSFLDEIASKMDYDEAMNLFGGNLSFNARIYLRSRYEETDTTNND